MTALADADPAPTRRETWSRSVTRRSRFWELVDNALSGPNLVLLCAFLVYGAAALFVTTLPQFPTPSLPIAVIGDWASWFEVDVVFPVLIVTVFLVFRPEGIRSALSEVALASMIPTYYVGASYVFLYNQTVYTGLGAVLLILIFVAPTMIGLLPLVGAWGEEAIEIRPAVTAFFARFGSYVIFLIPVLVVSLDIGLHLSGGEPSRTILWTSDIGSSVQNGGRLILHGINPYVVPLTPGATPAPLFYGPVTFLLVAPFGWLEVGLAAHISAAFFAGIAAAGVWKSLRLLNPRMATLGVALFLLLPSTDIAVLSGTTIHILAAAAVAWTLYFYLADRNAAAGLMCAMGALILVVPGALLLPFLASRRGPRQRLGLLLGFLPVVSLTAIAGVLVLHASRVLNLLSGLYHSAFGFAQFTVVWSMPASFRPLFIWPMLILVVGATLVLAFSARGDNRRTLFACLWFLSLFPLAIGYFLVYFFVWASVPLVLLTCSLPSTNVAALPESDLHAKRAAEGPVVLRSPGGRS